MAVARLKFLQKEEEELIHTKSIEALDSIGVLVRSDSVVSLLKESGALVDEKQQIVRMPEGMVQEALQKASEEFTLCARTPSNDITIPAETRPYMTTDGLTLYMIDIDTGEKRNANRRDFADFAKLADALDSIDFFWPIVTISDVPQNCHSSYELWTSLQNCTLHVQGDCTSPLDARKQIELASLVVGGAEELRKRPIFSAATNPISPLSFDKGAVEAQVEFAKAGVPILCHSMSMAGMSAPVTLAGTIVNINAENLASLVISQCASPGTPHIYGSSSTTVDMMTGGIDFTAPEGLLISAAAGQMAHRYGRPCMVANWGMGRNGQGIKISYSEALSYIATVFCGSDLIPGMGGLDSAKGCSLGQIMLDSLIWDNFSAFLREFKVDDDTIAFSAMKEVGQGNSFLTNPHTIKNFRKELFFWDKKKLALESTLSDAMIPDANKMAKKILSEHKVDPIDKDILQEGERILNEYARQVSE